MKEEKVQEAAKLIEELKVTREILQILRRAMLDIVMPHTVELVIKAADYVKEYELDENEISGIEDMYDAIESEILRKIEAL